MYYISKVINKHPRDDKDEFTFKEGDVKRRNRKNNKEEGATRLITNNKTGLPNKTTNTVNSSVNIKPKVKETAKDILHGA